jgi:radical SAM family RiPP maturation amino acid epimerase
VIETLPDVRPVLFNKRFIERWYADGEFRELAAVNAVEAAARYNLKADPEQIRMLWDPVARESLPHARDLPLNVRRYLAFQNEKARSRERYRAKATPHDPRFAAWRARMMARCVSHLGGHKAEYVVHAPMCFELSKGCSVGCWFCSVAAPRLSDQFLYTAENQKLWRQTLEVFQEKVGPPAGMAFCYWASDPLDNPDYERYLCDFHDILGEFPQTTTAQAQKHVERVRELLRLAEQRGGMLERFSILTLKQWNLIHEAFDPAELTYVECIPQNKEAYEPSKSISGRALERHRKRVAKNLEEPIPDDSTFTTACVSGFLVNMVDRTVRLITPCHACDRWPLGYWVSDHGTFTDAASLSRLLDRMVADNMPLTVPRDKPVGLRRDLKFSEREDGFEVSTRYWSQLVKGNAATREMGLLLERGKHTPAEIALELFDRRGAPLEETFLRLNDLLERGIVDEEPAGAQNALGEWIPAPMPPQPKESNN